jgi:hypothetical protein
METKVGIPGTMALASYKPKAVLHHWLIRDSQKVTLPEKEICNSSVLGRRIAYGSFRMTPPVIAVDADSNRIMTLDENVYELGTPDPGYALQNPHVLEEVGINICCG